MEHEKHRFQNLTYNELIQLRAIYQKRISDINNRLKKLIDGQELGIKSYDIIQSCDYHCKLLEDECHLISEKLSKVWKDVGGNISYNLLSYVLASCILDYYNYEYNPHTLIEKYDLDDEKFYRLYIKITEWLKENYWKR